MQSESWLATAARVLGVGIPGLNGLGVAVDLLLLGSPVADIPLVVYGVGVTLGVSLVISPAWPVFFSDDW